MYRPNVLTIGVNGAQGVGKTTLIDRLCLELGDEYNIGLLPDIFDDDSVTTDRLKRDDPSRIFDDGYFHDKDTEHLLFVEGNAVNYQQWASAGFVGDLIHVVDLDRDYDKRAAINGFVEHAGLLVANKLDLLDLTTPRLVEICLQSQIKRGLRPTVFGSMHTGFGLDLIVVYLKERIVWQRVMRVDRRR